MGACSLGVLIDKRVFYFSRIVLNKPQDVP